MDQWQQSWFQLINYKLDLILHRLTSPDPQKIAELTGHIEAKTAELQAAIDAQNLNPKGE